MARTNKYAAACEDCGTRVPANGGNLTKEGRRWVVRHSDCGSVVTVFSSGATVFENRRGRCEDAPCCGCCS